MKNTNKKLNIPKKTYPKSPKSSEIKFAIMTSGYAFPETLSEVLAYEKKFGKTLYSIPENLQNPNFLFERINKTKLETQEDFESLQKFVK